MADCTKANFQLSIAIYHSIGATPCAVRYSLARLKCLLPKNPL